MNLAKIQNILTTVTVLTALVVGLLVVSSPFSGSVSAAPPGCYTESGSHYLSIPCQTDEQTTGASSGNCYLRAIENGEVQDAVSIPCSNIRDEDVRDVNESFAQVNDCNNDSDGDGMTNDPDDCAITNFLVMFIDILSGLAGVVIVGSLIWAGIQYSSAGSDPQKVSEAKSRIRNAIIALLFFIFGFSLINFLIPGGLL